MTQEEDADCEFDLGGDDRPCVGEDVEKHLYEYEEAWPIHVFHDLAILALFEYCYDEEAVPCAKAAVMDGEEWDHEEFGAGRGPRPF